MLISVIMSVYNAEKYLNEAIDSILGQTYSSFEFIIIDDGSSDGSADIIQHYADKDSRIVFLKNMVNIGLPKSLNKGIHMAKGLYIARQDADDRSTPDRFENQLYYALKHEDIDIIGSNAYIIDVNGDMVCENRSFSDIKDHKQALLDRKAIFYHGSALIKKSTLIEVGLYDNRFYYSQDGELWLRFLANGAKIHTIADPLYQYRVLPIKTVKKYNAQASFNVVKHMIYVHHCSDAEINQKLIQIGKAIAQVKPQLVVPNFMAIYWKSLANTAYFNKSISKIIPYKYLIRAYKENRSSISRIHFFKLGLMYVLPKFIIRANRAK